MLTNLRHGVRAVVRWRTTLAFISTVGICVGLSTAAVSVLRTIMFPSVQIKDVEKLRWVSPGQAADGLVTRQWSVEEGAVLARSATRSRVTSLAERTIVVEVNRRPSNERVAFVDASFFDIAATSVLKGRLFGHADHGAVPVPVVLHYRFWMRRLGGDPSVLGHELRFNALSVKVVGVARADFSGPWIEPPVAWIPLWAADIMRAPGDPVLADGSGHVKLLAKLHDPSDAEIARLELSDLERALPMRQDSSGSSLRRVDERWVVSGSQTVARAVWAIAAILYCMAAGNIVVIFTLWGVSQSGSTNTYLALGATRIGIARDRTAGCLVLGLAAIPVAWVVAQACAIWISNTVDVADTVAVRLGTHALAGVTAGCLLCATIAAAVASVWSIGPRRSDRITFTYRSRAGGAAITAAYAGQIALGITVMLVAALIGQSARRVTELDTGMDVERLLQVHFLLPTDLRSAEATETTALIESSLVGTGLAESFGLSQEYVIGGGARTFMAHAGSGSLRVYRRHVSYDYFRALGIPVMPGTADAFRRSKGAVAIVSERLARTFWPDKPVVGADLGQIREDLAGTTIVGVAREVLPNNIFDAERVTTVYFPLAAGAPGTLGTPRNPPAPTNVIVRTAGDARDAAAAVRARLAGAFPDRRFDVSLVSDLLRRQTSSIVVPAMVAGVLAAAVFLLASIGVYSTAVLCVKQRARELGVRMALGATARQLLVHVIVTGRVAIVSGTILGLVGAWVSTSLVSTLLMGLDIYYPEATVLTVGGTIALTSAASTLALKDVLRASPATLMSRN